MAETSLPAMASGGGHSPAATASGPVTSGLEWYSWNEQAASVSQRFARALFERLGRAGIPPYRDFGPLVAVAATKEGEGP